MTAVQPPFLLSAAKGLRSDEKAAYIYYNIEKLGI